MKRGHSLESTGGEPAQPASPLSAMTDDTPTAFLTRAQLAERFQLSPITLAQWACAGIGPRFLKFRQVVRYRLSDVEAWEEAQMSGEAS